MCTAVKLLQAALEQLPEKAGSTRCKLDMAIRILSVETEKEEGK